MLTRNSKKKKIDPHLANQKLTQPSKVSAINSHLRAKQAGKHLMKEEIKTLKQQMEFILGVTKTGLDIIDSEFNIRYIDPGWAKVYGDPTGRKCYEYFMGGKAPCPGCGIPKALQTKEPIVTEEILVKENSRPIQVTTIPFRNTDGEWLAAEVNVDISERKRVEEELRKTQDELEIRIQDRTSQLALTNQAMQLEINEREQAVKELIENEKKYRDLTDSLPEIVFETDKEGKLSFANRLAFETFGYAQEEFDRGLTIFQMVIPDDRKRVEQHLQKLTNRGELISDEYTALRKDGSTFPVFASTNLIVHDNNPVGVRGVVFDMTKRKQAEERLRESEERYRTILENIEDGYYEVDLPGNFTFFNDSLCRMLGYSRDEMVGMGNQQYTDPENRKKLFQAFNEVYRTGIPTKGFDWEVIRKDGAKVFGEVSVSLIKDSKGQPIGFRGIARDITERKRAEEKMRALEEQLRQSQKIEAIGRLAGGIAHDFNNLLTVIKGYSQLSLLDLKESDPLWGNMQEIQKATQRATDLTRHLLAFSRRQILDPKVLDLNSLLRELDKMLRRIIGEDIGLTTQLANDLGRVKIDPGQFEQIVLNLAVNAKDAMPSGGKLIIETTNVELDGEYAFSHAGVIRGHYVRLSVSDTGLGMPRDVREKIFEPFFTTKEKGKGTGLGLSMVYGIVKQSGGNIWVYSEPGHGTTFKIYLPIVDEELETLSGRDEADSLPKGSETVLLVEDEPSVRELAHRLLRQQGYNVLEAGNGEEALGIVQKNHGETVHLLLTDVVMPQMGGKQLADQLKIVRPDLKVLYTSGYTDDAIVHHGALDPGTHFLQKPFSPKTLLHKVREVLDR